MWKFTNVEVEHAEKYREQKTTDIFTKVQVEYVEKYREQQTTDKREK